MRSFLFPLFLGVILLKTEQSDAIQLASVIHRRKEQDSNALNQFMSDYKNFELELQSLVDRGEELSQERIEELISHEHTLTEGDIQTALQAVREKSERQYLAMLTQLHQGYSLGKQATSLSEQGRRALGDVGDALAKLPDPQQGTKEQQVPSEAPLDAETVKKAASHLLNMQRWVRDKEADLQRKSVQEAQDLVVTKQNELRSALDALQAKEHEYGELSKGFAKKQEDIKSQYKEPIGSSAADKVAKMAQELLREEHEEEKEEAKMLVKSEEEVAKEKTDEAKEEEKAKEGQVKEGEKEAIKETKEAKETKETKETKEVKEASER